jgi:hypothetical protein
VLALLLLLPRFDQNKDGRLGMSDIRSIMLVSKYSYRGRSIAMPILSLSHIYDLPPVTDHFELL